MCNCLHPSEAWICGTVISKDGVCSPRLVFSGKEALDYYDRLGCKFLMQEHSITVPCGKCINCQMRKRKDMSVRLAHEASCHDECCFITLTYDQSCVPVTDWNLLKDSSKQFERGVGNLPEMTLCPRDVQLFKKRLNRYLEYHFGKHGIRYFVVGEYGSKTHRPHYHILVFGWTPKDKVLLKMHNGNPVYRSAVIESKWKYGFSSVSDVNCYVAKYAARYVTKKYAHLNNVSDNIVVPEFVIQSVRSGGMGALWFDRFGSSACERGFCTLRTSRDIITKHAIPAYYWSRLRKRNVKLWIKCRDDRIAFVKNHRTAVDFDDNLRQADFYHDQIRREIDFEFF